MKFSNRIKVILLFTVAFFTSAAVFSQNLVQSEPTQELEETINQTVEEWSQELALTSKQYDLMRRKLVEFAIKKHRLLQSKMREEAKTARLKELQIIENQDMRDILTQPQYDRYISILTQRIESQKDNS